MNDYLIEKRLKEEAPDLHNRMKDSQTALMGLLESFRIWFPDFTDHSTLHSMNVLNYCNQLLRDQVRKLTLAECYVLVMSCYLHDTGMGISRKSFEAMSRELNLDAYRREHPDASDASIIRAFHNEFSGLFIRKYADLFDIPSEELLFAIVQVSRGHRKTDLYNEKEYPIIKTSDGVIRSAYLSAVLRLADEIDFGVDRNPKFLFDTSSLTEQVDIDIFGIHESIRNVEVTENEIILHTKPKNEYFAALVAKLAGKMQKTLDYCRDVAQKRSDLVITQRKIVIAGQ